MSDNIEIETSSETSSLAYTILSKQIVQRSFFFFSIAWIFWYCNSRMGMRFSFSLGATIAMLLIATPGVIFYKLLAKLLAKISNATFMNTYLVLGLASIVNNLYFMHVYRLDPENFSMVMFGTQFIALFLGSLTVSGKLVWGCSWSQSFIASLLPVVLFAIMTLFAITRL